MHDLFPHFQEKKINFMVVDRERFEIFVGESSSLFHNILARVDQLSLDSKKREN